ncbi:hypothetical protein GCM10010439_39850 [Actinocorallia aurantiaca]|uniref:Uncharacterized protein n=1 Tax=Actinocorallia aurantiaca TaxID=46204 RepID=A0ABP6GQU7_9ACTN
MFETGFQKLIEVFPDVRLHDVRPFRVPVGHHVANEQHARSGRPPAALRPLQDPTLLSGDPLSHDFATSRSAQQSPVTQISLEIGERWVGEATTPVA